MSATFIQRVEADLQRQLQAMRDLREAAEKSRQAGDWQSYWDLIAPGTEGDLHAFLGREAEASAFFRAAVQHFDDYRVWAQGQGQQAEITEYEASMCLKAGLAERAKAMYRYLAAGQDDAAKSMLGIALINAGAVEEGSEHLRWRVTHLDLGTANTPTRWYHLAECYLWLEDHQQSQEYAVRAVDTWDSPPLDPPVLAFAHLTRYVIAQDPVSREAAAQALEATMRWFYHAGDIPHARDAREYLKVLDRIKGNQPFTGLPILGMSFMRG